jgi:hydrogenase nickel incorporation protein HypA/HybF
MHELAICQSLLAQSETIARQQNAVGVKRIIVQIGPLSGVIPGLLERTFMVARRGTLAECADLVTEQIRPRIRCRSCGKASIVPMNRLTCPECGDFHVDLLQGDELILKTLELEMEERQLVPRETADFLMEEARDV